MSNEVFQAGDVVQLKSGGAIMTIEWVRTVEKDCKCSWFDSSGKIHNQMFAIAALEKPKL